MTSKYLDYEHLYYYHQKLKLQLETISLSENDIENIFSQLNRKYNYTVPNDGFFRIKLASRWSPSSTYTVFPVEWQTNNFTITNNSEYAFADAFSTCTGTALLTYNKWGSPVRVDYEANGIAIELLCTDQNNNYHYFSTIGKEMTNFSRSEHTNWSWMSLSNVWNGDEWNVVTFQIPTGQSKIYHLNYHSNNYDFDEEAPLNKKEGTFVPSNEFIDIRIIHNQYESYSIIIS